MFGIGSYHIYQQRAYAAMQLMRLDRPIGILLLLWPTLIALWFAGMGHPDWKSVGVFTLGVFLMRSAGCVVNDLADRKFDGFVTRTKERVLVTGRVSVKQAKILLATLLMLSFLLVCTTNLFTIYLSIFAALIACCYPFAKRFTYFPQLVLGIAFGWSIPMAYATQSDHLSLECWILFVANLFWVLAYDTLYAMADKADDLKIGVKSSAIAFGQYDKLAVGICHLVALALFVLLGKMYHLGVYYYISLTLALMLALYQQYLVAKRDPKACFQAFMNNQWFGAVIFVGVCCS